MMILEKYMEDQIAQDPQTFLQEPELKLICRQYSIGKYRFDLLFEDRHGAKLIVEIQRGTLDRNHTYKILDYYDEYKEKNPSEFVELMVVANHIPKERRERLRSKGISFREIPVSMFAPDSESPDGSGAVTNSIEELKTAEIGDHKAKFEKLLKREDWKNKHQGITRHRKEQFEKILMLYHDNLIPFSHFSDDRIKDPEKRNAEIYPIIAAYYAGLLEIVEDGLLAINESTSSQDAGHRSLLELIKHKQPSAEYLKHLDSPEKIRFIEGLHSLLTKKSHRITRIFNKKEISYTYGPKFACIVPQKNKIVIGPLLTKFDQLEDPKKICRDIRNVTYSSGGEVRADFTSPYDDIDYAVFLLNQSLIKIFNE